MEKTKLTLTINPDLLAQARNLAKERGTSLSSLVEGFFERLLAQQETQSKDHWITQMDQLLVSMWANKPEQKEIDRVIQRDHDDFEQRLIDDLSQEFLK